MNILGFIFSLLLLLTFGFAASWDKQIGATRLRSSYLGHHKSARLIVNQSESAVYKDLSYKKKSKKAKNEKTAPATPKVKIAPPNGICSRLNLWPLVIEGQTAHPQLYDLTCKLLDRFYRPLLPCSSKQFLDRFLKTAKTALKDPDPCPLEKLHLSTEEDRIAYYHMLKGTKQYEGCPPLTDFIKIDPNWAEKLCLSHAHPSLLQILFGAKVGDKLYTTLHQKKPPPVTPELIDQLCSEMHQIAPDIVGLYDLLLFGHPKHPKAHKIALCAQAPSTDICLKSQVFLPETKNLSH